MVDEGNLVQASDTNGFVVITQIQPISVLFNLPQQQFQQVNKAFAKGPLRVDALGGRRPARSIDRGTLQVIDNQMDQTTGTIRMKAEFPNANLQLWPGQFVNIRVLVDTLKQVVVVPTAAVQRGPQGTFVYVVDAESKVAVRPITVAQQDDTRAVISDGVKAQEQVVTTGFTRLSNGTRVARAGRRGRAQPARGDTAQAPQARAAAKAGASAKAGRPRIPTARSAAAAPRTAPATPSAKQ